MENEKELVNEVDIGDPIEESDETVDQPVDDRDYDTEAATMGHSAKEDWRGSPDDWVDAKTFVERGEKILPIVRSENRRLKKEMTDLKSNYTTQSRILKKLVDTSYEENKRTHEKILTDLKVQKREAMKENDGAQTAELDAEIEDFEKRAPKKVEVEDEKPADADWQGHLDGWIENNRWYESDPLMAADAEGMFKTLGDAGHVSREKALEIVAKEIKEKYPNKFSNPKRKTAATVETPGGGGSGNVGYAALPVGAKKVFESEVAEGIWENTKEAKERFAAYLSEGE